MPPLTWPPSAALVLLLWPFLTALASIAYRYAEAQPRLHAALSTLASLGIDLPKLWDALGRMWTGNLPPSTAAMRAARLSSRGFARLPALSFVMLVGAVLCFACGACSWLSSPTGKKVSTVSIDATVCILNHVKDPPVQIAAECGLATVEDVVKVLDAHRAAMVREGFVLPPDAGAR